MESSEGDEHADSKPGFFSKLLTIPCMRTSLLNGISCGLGVGLTYFLLTSNVRKATNWGTGGFLLIMYGSWGFCRYKLAQERYTAYKWQKIQQQKSGKIELIDPKDV